MKTVAILLSLVLVGTFSTPIFAANFNSEVTSKSVVNYTLDDIAFQICMKEYEIYEKTAASALVEDPHKLSQWTQYTNCHDDAFVILDDIKAQCADAIQKAKNVKTIHSSIVSEYDRMHYADYMYAQWDKAIDCHKDAYYQQISNKPIPKPIESTGFKAETESNLKIVSGEGTIDIDGICQVEKQIETQKKPKKSSGWFNWLWGWFS